MRTHRRSPRRGVIVPLTALMIVVILGMVAFAVDSGHITNARTELQRMADACALAAAYELPIQADATKVAQDYANLNGGFDGKKLSPSLIDFGYWDRDTAQFIQPPPANRSINAVRVELERSNGQGTALPLFVARVLGVDRAEVSASAIAMYDRWLCGPFVGIDWVDVPGSPQTDSFNSSDGSYSSQSPGYHGSLCSDGWIDVDGAALVKGDAHSGKGHDVTLYGGALVTGAIGERLKPLNMPPVDASEAAVTNDNASMPLIQKGNSYVSPIDADGNFLLDGTTNYTVPPGTYYVNDFVIEGQSVFNVTGPTTIYVAGDMRRAGGTIVNNLTQVASNMQIKMTGGTANVTSNNAFYGLIYAPHSDVTVDGDSSFFGAIVGKTLTITGSGFGHYDEALDLHGEEFPKRTALVD